MRHGGNKQKGFATLAFSFKKNDMQPPRPQSKASSQGIFLKNLLFILNKHWLAPVFVVGHSIYVRCWTFYLCKKYLMSEVATLVPLRM